MLNENQVVEAVCNHLKSEGFQIKNRCSTKQQGYDIDAINPGSGRRLIIEAKGASSARKDSARYGKAFSDNQVRSHVARAFYAAAATLQKEGGNVDVGIALPDQVVHKKFIEGISQSLHTLGILVYWVTDDLAVRMDSPMAGWLLKT